MGYAHVSTDEQATQAQEIELRAAGCETIIQEHGSGASRIRPALAKLVREIGAGDTSSSYVSTDWRDRSATYSK